MFPSLNAAIWALLEAFNCNMWEQIKDHRPLKQVLNALSDNPHLPQKNSYGKQIAIKSAWMNKKKTKNKQRPNNRGQILNKIFTFSNRMQWWLW